jgi:hypothetical protein
MRKVGVLTVLFVLVLLAVAVIAEAQQPPKMYRIGVLRPDSMKDGPLTAEQIAAAIGVGPSRLRVLLYVLVTAGLLTEQDGPFSNTAEANHFLVKGLPRTWATDTQP